MDHTQSNIRVWSLFEVITGDPLEWLLVWDFTSRAAATRYILYRRQGRTLMLMKRYVKRARFSNKSFGDYLGYELVKHTDKLPKEFMINKTEFDALREERT